MPETISVTFIADSAKFQQEAAKVIGKIAEVEKTAKSASASNAVLQRGGGLNPQTLQGMEKAAAITGELARKTNQAGQAGKNGSFGFLAFSQAVEDAQYGVKGVLNNIPQMVMGFGGSAGLAGALSLASVAAYGAYKAFQQLAGIDGMEKWAKDSAKATNIFTEAIRRNKEETLSLQRKTQNSEILEINRVFGEASIRRNVAVDRGPYEAGEEEAARVARQRAAENAILSAGFSTAVTGETPDQLASRETQEAKQKFLIDQSRLTEDLAAAQANLNRISEDYTKLSTKSDADTVRLSKDRREALKTEEEARLKMASLDAELQRARAQVTADPLLDTFNRNRQEAEVRAIEKKIELQKDWIQTTKDQVSVQDGLLKKLEEPVTADRKFLEGREKAARKDIEAGKESLRYREKLAELEAKEIQMRALHAKAPALQEAVDTARQQQQAAAPDLQDLILSRARRDGKITPQAGRDAAQAVQDAREAERRSKENGLSETDNQRIIEEMRKNEEFLRRNTGTVKDRREQRTADRQAARDEQRNERVRSAARQRESRDQNGRQIPDDRIDPGAKAEEAGKRVDDAQAKADSNAAEQTAIQQQIKEALDKLSNNLGTA